MKSLKQTLSREQPKKMNKNMTATAYKSKKSTWQELHSLIQCKSPKKTIIESTLEQEIIGTIDEAFKLNGLIQFEKVLEEVLMKVEDHEKRKKTNFSNQSKTKEEAYEKVKEIVEGILQKSEKSRNCQPLIKFDSFLGRFISKKQKIARRQKVEQFDKLIRMLSPKNFGSKVEKRQKHSVAQIPNVKVKVTREEYQIRKEDEEAKSRNSSAEKSKRKMVTSVSIEKNNRSKNLSEAKSEDGFDRLKKLMDKSKDGSYKIIKTKISYDYSAILEASKTKIKTRNNKNMTHDPAKNENSMSSKLNKVKKNQAFVFYRPQTKGSSGMQKKEKGKKNI